MKDEDKRVTRKTGRHLRVPVLPEEEAEMKQRAQAAGLSVAAYLRNVGLGYEIRGVLDQRRVDDLAKVNGDLGRLGGLLKLCLANDPKTARFDAKTVRVLLGKIEDTQGELRRIMRTVVQS